MFRWKKKRKKDIFNERRIFNIFHPRYRRVTCRDRSRDISPHLFPRSNFMQIHRRISITTIKPGLETVLASIETLRPIPILARNLSALIINAMFNAYFAMLITRLTRAPVTRNLDLYTRVYPVYNASLQRNRVDKRVDLDIGHEDNFNHSANTGLCGEAIGHWSNLTDWLAARSASSFHIGT